MNSLIVLLVVAFLVLTFMVISKISSLTKNLNNGGQIDAEYTPVDSYNDLNGKLLIGFFVVGVGLAIWSYFNFEKRMMLPIASEHGVNTDSMFWLSMGLAVLAFFVTNAFLFYFSYKYRYVAGRKATYYPVNHTLEYVWTATPAVLMAIMVFFGWKLWSDITKQEPDNAIAVEIMGKQFGWYVRYGGADDNKLGAYNYKLIVDGKNDHGIDLSDEASFDDFTATELHIKKGQPVVLKIRARDVLHSVFLPHFRVKMDAVPGMPTKFWFTPTKSTAEMRYETGKSDFNYFITCTEICGRGHFGMKIPVFVDEEEDYKKWIASQPTWLSLNKGFLTLVPEKLKAKASKYAGVEEVESDTTATAGVGGVSASASLK
jgi:cytochrome c oxidase subunit 2